MIYQKPVTNLNAAAVGRLARCICSACDLKPLVCHSYLENHDTCNTKLNLKSRVELNTFRPSTLGNAAIYRSIGVSSTATRAARTTSESNIFLPRHIPGRNVGRPESEGKPDRKRGMWGHKLLLTRFPDEPVTWSGRGSPEGERVERAICVPPVFRKNNGTFQVLFPLPQHITPRECGYPGEDIEARAPPFHAKPPHTPPHPSLPSSLTVVAFIGASKTALPH